MVGPAVARRPPPAPGHPHSSKAPVVLELLTGCLLLVGATLGGLVVAHRPWANRVDITGFRLLPADASSRWAVELTRLGSTHVLIAGVAVLGCIALMQGDRTRAIACVVAPLCAVLVVELVAKPLVGRRLEDSAAFTYPSGTVTAVAALAAATLLVAPRGAKSAVALLGGAVVSAICVAVVVLRWHYPTDALGGVSLGAGAVFTLDGALRLLSRSEPRVRRP